MTENNLQYVHFNSTQGPCLYVTELPKANQADITLNNCIGNQQEYNDEQGYKTDDFSLYSDSASECSDESDLSNQPSDASPRNNSAQTRVVKRRRLSDQLIPPNCPLTKEQIIDLPIDEFNELVEKHSFLEYQRAQFRDWRRRGKNRVAAKKSRQKRICYIDNMKQILAENREEFERLQLEILKMKKRRNNLLRAIEIIERQRGIKKTSSEKC